MILWQKWSHEIRAFGTLFTFLDLLEHLIEKNGPIKISLEQRLFTISDIKFPQELGTRNMSTSHTQKDTMQNLLDIRNITLRTAKKNHLCNFSGVGISIGDQYWEISFTRTEGGSHYTYRVAQHEFEQFIKEKVFMTLGDDYEEMEKDVSELGLKIDAMYEKYKDLPGFEEKYLRIVSLASRNQ